MQKYVELPNSEIERRISEYIHSEKYRRVMRMKLIDGLTLERIAEVVEMSPAQVYRIVKQCKKMIEI